MSEIKTLKFPGDVEPREIVDAKAREDISKLSDEIANIPSGADGKSAYQYAVDGGYTGTEEEFAAKLAEEMPDALPNPNALTFTGAVEGSYDGSEALTVDIPSGGGGVSVPKPLTYDYMPEGYPTKSVQTTTLMEEQDLAFTLSNGQYNATITNAFEIVEGQTYAVKWDGTEYECVGFAYHSGPVSIPAIGNLSIAGVGGDTGEPFIYVYNEQKHSGNFGTNDSSASHTISVKTTSEVITPMAEEFLPSGIMAAAFITYDADSKTYSSDLTYDEMHDIMFLGGQVVLRGKNVNDYQYLTKWKIGSYGNSYRNIFLHSQEEIIAY